MPKIDIAALRSALPKGDYESAPFGGPRVLVLPAGSVPTGKKPTRVRSVDGPTTLETLREHPGSVAAGLATLAVPVSTPGAVLAGLLASLIGGLAVGGGTELPDATNRTSPDEHKVRTQK